MKTYIDFMKCMCVLALLLVAFLTVVYGPVIALMWVYGGGRA